MSNIHGLGGPNPNNNNRRNVPPIRRNGAPPPDDNDNGGFFDGFSEPVLAEQLRIAEENRILFISGRNQVKNPQEENYWDMLKFALCPTFKFLSLTFLISLADIALFIFEVSVGLDKSSNYLLKVNADTLISYGGNYQPRVLSGQVYRLISAMFLHVYFMHIFGNLITTFMFLSRIEYTFGFLKTLAVYLITGISGNIFSLLCSPQGVKAGASTALFGIIGVIIGYIVINWNGLDLVGSAMKCQIWCQALLIIVFIFIFTPSSGDSSIDYYGHLGGFLAGVWISCIHESIINTTREKVLRIVFGLLLISQLLICFLVFYLSSKPVS
jgi:rhomboid protease GluP